MPWAMSSDIDRTGGLTMACLATLIADGQVLTVSGKVPSTQALKALGVNGTQLVTPSQGPRLTF